MSAAINRKYLSLILIMLPFLFITPAFSEQSASVSTENYVPITLNSSAMCQATHFSQAIDNDKVVWADNRLGGGYKIYLKDLTLERETRIGSGTHQFNPAISGNKVVWSEPLYEDNGHLGQFRLFVTDLTSGAVTRVSDRESDQYYPSISGTKIVWQDYADGGNIYLRDLQDSIDQKISTGSKQYMPAISGNKIVWQDLRNNNFDIYLYDISNKQESRLTANTSDQVSPVISGNTVVWEDHREFWSRIYAYDLDTSTEKKISEYNSVAPAIYSNKVVWQDSRNGNWDIYLYDLTSGKETQITSDPNSQEDPSISGDKILWRDNRNGNCDIYMYDISSGITSKANSNQTFLPASQQRPAVCGNRVFWEDDRDGWPHIYMRDLSTGVERRLSSSAASQQYPSVFGNLVTWLDSRDEGSIYLYDLSDSTEKQIAANIWINFQTNAGPRIKSGKVVWTSWYNNMGGSIYLYDISSNETTKLVSGNTQQYFVKEPDIYGDSVVWAACEYKSPSHYEYTLRLHNLTTHQESILDRQNSNIGSPKIFNSSIVYQIGDPNLYWWPCGVFVYDIALGTKTMLGSANNINSQPELKESRTVWIESQSPPWSSDYAVVFRDLDSGVETNLLKSRNRKSDPDLCGSKVTWEENNDWPFYDSDIEMISLLKGDTNGSEAVDIFDLVIVGRSFGLTRSSPKWDFRADLNSDGMVNIFDLVTVGKNFGKKFP